MKIHTLWHQKLGIGTLALGLGLGLALGLGAGVANAQNLIVDGDAEAANTKNWFRMSAVSDDAHDGNHSFQVDGYVNVQAKPFIKVDPSKHYNLSGWFKSAGEKPSKIYFGFVPFDQNKKQIMPWHVNVVAGTDTTLAEACVKGDTVIKITDGSKWKALKHLAMAFDTKADFSDLPNKQISALGITAVQNKGDHWEITLAKPCKQDKDAGTSIRMHRSGGTYIYAGASNKIVPSEWTQYAGKIKGSATKGIPLKQFWPGTKFVRILILANYGMKKKVSS